MRRHFLSCKKRGERPIPEKQKRGRRKCACDRCASLKSACDRQRPCNTCRNGGVPCTWNRVQQEAVLAAPAQPPPPDGQASPDSTLGDSGSVPSLRGGREESGAWVPDDPAQEVVETSPESSIPPFRGRARTITSSLEKMTVPFLVNFVSKESRSIVETFGYSNAAPEPLPLELPSQSPLQTTEAS